MAKIVRTPASNAPLLRDILDQLKDMAGDMSDVEERIQQQLAMVNEDANLQPGERHYA